jgi:Kef-type K+ transport system membrane component KefB
VIAEIIAGIVIGPSVMGQIPGFNDLFFPSSSIPLLNIIANVGLILFMFVIGMEIDLDLFRSKIKKGTVWKIIISKTYISIVLLK